MPIEAKISSHHFSRYYTALEPFLVRPKVRAYTMLTLSLLAISFFGYFAIRPTLTTISTLRRQIADARLVDQKLQEKINALSAASREYEAIRPDLDLISTALPPQTRFPEFIKSLEKLATESGGTITNLTFAPLDLTAVQATTSGKEIPISFNLTLTGNYVNLADFLKRIGHFERLIIIETAQISGKEESGGLRLVLSGKTFYVQ